MSKTGQSKDGGAVRQGGVRLTEDDKRKLGRAACPDLLRRICVAGRRPEEGLALAVVVALANLGASAEHLAVSARLIREQTGQWGNWCEDEVVWVCRNFIGSGFNILEADDHKGRDIPSRRFFLSTEADEIAHTASMLRVQAEHMLGKADLLAKAAFASKVGTAIWAADRGEKLAEAVGIGGKKMVAA